MGGDPAHLARRSGPLFAGYFHLACLRSFSLNSTCTSFSASAKVEDDTSGPTGGAVAKAGGDPGGGAAGFFSWLHEVTAIPRTPRELLVKNCLRDFDMAPLLRILTVQLDQDSFKSAKG